LDSILQFDEWLFSLLNGTFRADFLDSIAPMWRNKYFWVPFYLFILAIVGINFRNRFLPFVLFAVLTITVADTISSRVIKPLVKRDRPCRAEHLQKPAVVLISCGGGYSFTSSHATNHFAMEEYLPIPEDCFCSGRLAYLMDKYMWGYTIPLIL